jgi:hypothetical protein
MKFGGWAALASFAFATSALADDLPFDLSGQVDLGVRYYFEDGLYAGQSTAGAYPFVGLQLNGGFSVGGGEFVFQFSGLSDEENDRSILNFQKAYYYQAFESWDLVAGFNVENWGISTGRSLVNVLNARDRANQVGGSDLIGTPMVNANFFTDAGTLSFYVLGGEVQDNFGGPASRQRGPLFTDGDFAAYQDDGELDFALRYSNNFYIGENTLDLGFYYYQGTNREAVSLPGCTSTSGAVTSAVCDQITTSIRNLYEAGGTQPLNAAEMTAYLLANFGAAVAAEAGNIIALAPYYQDIRQWGLTAVYAQGNTQLRFEGFLRDTEYESFAAAIVGGDYTFYDFAGGDGTLTFALEYHFDDRSVRQPTSIFDNDAFLGLNFSANDANDTRGEFGLFYDLDTDAQLYTLSISRRIGERFRAELNVNHVEAAGTGDPLSAVDGDSFVSFTLSTFF